jgi:hypothetical protein
MELYDASSEAQREGAESLGSNMTRPGRKQDHQKRIAAGSPRDAATGVLAQRAAIG